ncbi:MAG: hypothetical protein ACYDCQ_07630 [Dehalococcoidia bacterium]
MVPRFSGLALDSWFPRERQDPVLEAIFVILVPASLALPRTAFRGDPERAEVPERGRVTRITLYHIHEASQDEQRRAVYEISGAKMTILEVSDDQYFILASDTINESELWIRDRLNQIGSIMDDYEPSVENLNSLRETCFGKRDDVHFYFDVGYGLPARVPLAKR